jgi:hypothetical protein
MGDVAVAGAKPVTIVADHGSFQLSRVYAQGWNAARRLPANARLDPKAIADLNPHKSEPERTRWSEGFLKASE